MGDISEIQLLRARTSVEGLDRAVHELQNILNGMREAFRQRFLPPVDYATQHWLRGAKWEILSSEEAIASVRADIVESHSALSAQERFEARATINYLDRILAHTELYLKDNEATIANVEHEICSIYDEDDEFAYDKALYKNDLRRAEKANKKIHKLIGELIEVLAQAEAGTLVISSEVARAFDMRLAGLDEHDKHEDGEDIEEEISVGAHVVYIEVRSGKET